MRAKANVQLKSLKVKKLLFNSPPPLLIMSVYIYTKVLPSSLGLLRVRGNSERETTKQGLKLRFFERFLINNSLKKK